MNRNVTLVLVLIGLVGCAEEGVEEPEPARAEITAFVRGPLSRDAASARAMHDQIAAGGQPGAVANGDLAHQVFLGTGDTGRPVDEFVGLDQWTSADGALAVYGDPDFQAAFSQLFAEPVIPGLYQRSHDWHGWGDLTPPTDGQTYWIMVVRGRLKQTSLEANRAAHDAVASGFQAAAEAAGDVAHVPHLAIDDPRMFFNIDVSTSREGLLGVLSNPQFGEQFGALFEGAPDVAIYRSTDWYQW